jgi:Tfp pilus assembly protein PilE
MLSFMGTGIMRIVNFFLVGALVVILLLAAWNSYKEGIRDEGRQEVRTEVQQKNDELDRHVTEVNENITRRVIRTNETIEHKSRTIEDDIKSQPSEPITNVTRRRLERVREQQRDIREAS